MTMEKMKDLLTDKIITKMFLLELHLLLEEVWEKTVLNNNHHNNSNKVMMGNLRPLLRNKLKITDSHQ